MNSRLAHVRNWPELAKDVKWSVAGMARACQVSERTLRRHFQETFGEAPGVWLHKQRMEKAVELSRLRWRIKEIANELQYGHSNNLSRDFKKYYGFCLTSQNPSPLPHTGCMADGRRL